MVLLPRQRHGAAPLFFAVAEHGDRDMNLSAAERLVPILRIVLAAVEKDVGARRHSYSKRLRKALQRLLRHAQRHQAGIADRYCNPGVRSFPPIGRGSDMRREPSQELAAARVHRRCAAGRGCRNTAPADSAAPSPESRGDQGWRDCCSDSVECDLPALTRHVPGKRLNENRWTQLQRGRSNVLPRWMRVRSLNRSCRGIRRALYRSSQAVLSPPPSNPDFRRTKSTPGSGALR